MIRLRTFGGVDLRLAEDDRPVQSVLAQPKRTGLLIHLAVLRGRETRRRDALLGVFWPESDTQRSRNSLNQAIHYLRRSLHEDLIESRGDEELGVAPGSVWCDATELEEALGRGDRERALDLYAGDFLDGFFVDGAPEFERWADEERGRFRRMAVGAAREMADTAATGGDRVAAERWLRRVLEIEPYNARAVYELIELLAADGERVRALELAEEHRAGLKREFDADPSPELDRLVDTLRTSPHPAPPAVRAVAAVERGGQTGARAPASEFAPASSTVAPATGGAANGDQGVENVAWPTDQPGGDDGAGSGVAVPATPPRNGRRLLPVLLGLAVVVLLVAAAWAWMGGASPVPAGSGDRIAVFPFSFRGSADLGYLGEGASSLLTTTLDEMDDLDGIDSHAVFAAVRGDASGPMSPRRGAEIAAMHGAGLFVLGDIVEISEQIRLQAAVYRTGPEGAALIGRAWVQGRTDDVFTLVDQLAPEIAAAALAGDSIP